MLDGAPFCLSDIGIAWNCNRSAWTQSVSVAVVLEWYGNAAALHSPISHWPSRKLSLLLAAHTRRLGHCCRARVNLIGPLMISMDVRRK